MIAFLPKAIPAINKKLQAGQAVIVTVKNKKPVAANTPQQPSSQEPQQVDVVTTATFENNLYQLPHLHTPPPSRKQSG